MKSYNFSNKQKKHAILNSDFSHTTDWNYIWMVKNLKIKIVLTVNSCEINYLSLITYQAWAYCKIL